MDNEKKDEAYWLAWFKEHDTEEMVLEVVDLNHSIHDGAKDGTLSPDQIITRGVRQAALIHDLLEVFSVAEVAEETGFTLQEVTQLNSMHLARRSDGEMVNPTWN